MHNRFLLYIIPITFCIAIVACSQKSKYVMNQDKMVEVLCDVHLANAIASSDGGNNVIDKRKDMLTGVFDKHGITQADYDSSMVWYADNIKIFMEVNDSVVSRLKSNSDVLMRRRNEMLIPAGRDYRILPSIYQLNAITPNLIFNLDTVTFKDIDLAAFRVQFDVQGISEDLDLKAGIYYKYKDTLVSDIFPLKENKHYSFAKPELPDSLLNSISGYIHMRRKSIKPSTKVNVYNISYQDSLLMDKGTPKLDGIELDLENAK